jgi:hypothetical protein
VKNERQIPETADVSIMQDMFEEVDKPEDEEEQEQQEQERDSSGAGLKFEAGVVSRPQYPIIDDYNQFCESEVILIVDNREKRNA